MDKKIPKEEATRQSLQSLMEKFHDKQKGTKEENREAEKEKYKKENAEMVKDMEKLSIKYGSKFLVLACKEVDDGMFGSSFSVNLHGDYRVKDTIMELLKASIKNLEKQGGDTPDFPEGMPEELKAKLKELKDLIASERHEVEVVESDRNEPSEVLDLTKQEGRDALLLTLQNLRSQGAKDDNPLVKELLQKLDKYRKK